MDRPLRIFRSAVAWVSRTAWFRRVGPRLLPPLERLVARLTGGRVTAAGLVVPALVLHTIGARTGQPRQTELMCVPDGSTWLVTGSNFGRRSHPAWTWNLMAHPDAVIDVHGRRVPVHADLVPDDERDRTWAILERQWPGYRQYEVAAGRALRIFRLTPRRVALERPDHGGGTSRVPDPACLASDGGNVPDMGTLDGEYAPSAAGWVRDQVRAFEASGGADANVLRGTNDPIVVITHRGAATGKIRKTPLMRVEKDGKYLAVGSYGGAARNPAWVHNFRANPQVELQDGPVRRPYVARELAGEERAQWWEHAVATWAQYGRYQERTDRQLPLFLLEPVG